MSDESLNVPQADRADAAHLVASTLIGLIPFVGGTDLFKFIVSPSLEKRRERWMQLVTDAIKELQAHPKFSVELLRENEEFTTLLVQTTQAAMSTHLESKHRLLKTVLINAALADYDFDSKQVFVSMVDRFTPSHIHVLALVEKTKQHTVKKKSGQQYYAKLIEMQVDINVAIDGVMFLAILEDLHSAGLLVLSSDFIITDGDVEQVSTLLTEDSGSSGLPQMNTTDLARHFLLFIAA